MRLSSHAVGVFVSAVFLAAATGCSSTAGTPVAQTEGTPATSQTTSPQTTTPHTALPSSEAPPEATPVAPTGEPVGTAVMAVRGGDATVTIRYRINGGTEQTETNVTLPWEKQYSVYEELQSEVSADGGDTELICTIIMDGDKLVSFVTEARPTCSFAYWG